MDCEVYYCTACGKEQRIPLASSWPSGCVNCGNRAFSSAPRAEPMPITFGPIDVAGAARAALRQPGSPHLPAPF